MTFAPQTIRAYVDGELDDLTAARIERAAETDDELAAVIREERRLRDILGAHFAPILSEPVPARITAPIEVERKVASLDDARERRLGLNARTLRWAAPAMAAALVLALVVPAMQGGPTESRDGLTFAANDLEQALDEQLVAEQHGGSDTRIMMSFADAQGKLCRGFARSDLSGIACRESGGWHLRVQRDGIDIASEDYRQASSVDGAIMAAAQDMTSSPALDPEQERAAKARGWKIQ